MPTFSFRLSTMLALAACLAACTGAPATPTATTVPTPAPTIDPTALARGKGVYARAGCTACHAIAGVGTQGDVAPALDRMGALALERIASEDYAARLTGQPPAATAEEYILQSILHPAAYEVRECPAGPCQPGSMPNNYLQVIRDEQDMRALVAYLNSLR